MNTDTTMLFNIKKLTKEQAGALDKKKQLITKIRQAYIAAGKPVPACYLAEIEVK